MFLVWGHGWGPMRRGGALLRFAYGALSRSLLCCISVCIRNTVFLRTHTTHDSTLTHPHPIPNAKIKTPAPQLQPSRLRKGHFVFWRFFLGLAFDAALPLREADEPLPLDEPLLELPLLPEAESLPEEEEEEEEELREHSA